MPLKDFSDDIRANRDLEKFVVSPVVLLDVSYRSKQITMRIIDFKIPFIAFNCMLYIVFDTNF